MDGIHPTVPRLGEPPHKNLIEAEARPQDFLPGRPHTARSRVPPGHDQGVQEDMGSLAK